MTDSPEHVSLPGPTGVQADETELVTDDLTGAQHVHVKGKCLICAVDEIFGGCVVTDSPETPTPVGSCDWGDCDDEAVVLRLDRSENRWLPVCERHRPGNVAESRPLW